MHLTVTKIEKQLLPNDQKVTIVHLAKESEFQKSQITGVKSAGKYVGYAANLELALYEEELVSYYEQNLGKAVDVRV